MIIPTRHWSKMRRRTGWKKNWIKGHPVVLLFTYFSISENHNISGPFVLKVRLSTRKVGQHIFDYDRHMPLHLWELLDLWPGNNVPRRKYTWIRFDLQVCSHFDETLLGQRGWFKRHKRRIRLSSPSRDLWWCRILVQYLINFDSRYAQEGHRLSASRNALLYSIRPDLCRRCSHSE